MRHVLSPSNFDTRNSDKKPFRFQCESFGQNDMEIINRKKIVSPDTSKHKMIKVYNKTWIMSDGIHSDQELIEKCLLTKKINERNF